MICEWDTARFLIFSDNGIPLIYYSHFTSIAIFAGLFIVTFLRLKPWPKRAFRMMCLAYVAWLACDLVLWANEIPDNVIFFWSVINLVEPLIFASAYAYFVSFTEQRILSRGERWTISLLLLPTVIIAPLNFSVVGFDLTTCDRNAIEGIGAYYNYFLEAIFTGLVLLQAIKRFIVIRFDPTRVYRLLFATVSLVLLMSSFLLANFLGTFFEAYDISQLGHIAVPVFAALLSYITIKFETLQPRIMLIDILSIALLVLVFSLFFIQDEQAQQYVILFTFILSLPLTYLLSRGIRKEVDSRIQIEKFAADLQEANAGQENLIHIMNHQIKGYLGKGRNIFAELMNEPSYCAAEEAKPMLAEGLKSLTEGVEFVQQVLNGSNAARGTLTYTMKPLDFKALVSEMAEKLRSNAEEKKLSYSLELSPSPLTISADELQLKEAVKNLIDNSIRYTVSGGLTLKLEEKSGKALFSVSDTGIGITAEDKPKLFTKGGKGKDSLKYNVNSTGYGLAFVKGVIDAHKGRVWAESEGADKGSQFYMELPLSQQQS